MAHGEGTQLMENCLHAKMPATALEHVVCFFITTSTLIEFT